MEDFNSNSNSKPYADGRMQIESYYGNDSRGGPIGAQDFRSYSASYANPTQIGNDLKLKKGKSTNGFSSKSWSFNDPELQRKKRVASYKVYTVEGKVKGSFRKSFRWLKDRCSRLAFGW